MLSVSANSARQASNLDRYRRGAQRRSLPCSRSREYRVSAIQVREQPLQILDLRQIVNHDVRIARVARQEILVVVLGRIKRVTSLDGGHDGRIEHASSIEL